MPAFEPFAAAVTFYGVFDNFFLDIGYNPTKKPTALNRMIVASDFHGFQKCDNQ